MKLLLDLLISAEGYVHSRRGVPLFLNYLVPPPGLHTLETDVSDDAVIHGHPAWFSTAGLVVGAGHPKVLGGLGKDQQPPGHCDAWIHRL